ncbi:MAG: hypothetical protein RIC30_16390 [Marinoscillum sp.]|uniref:tellurite resistance TerB family protein n=1 Tax=Marinoscillum sp. TaxID=2024838 RepID=UPI0032F55BEA
MSKKLDKSQISILIHLASMDGAIDDTEKGLISRIGMAHGLSEEELKEYFDNPPEKIDFSTLSEDESFDTLYNLVHLMKVDGKIFDEEIGYCMNMAKKLGYPMEAVMDLYSQVHANVKLKSEIQKIKRKYHKKG